MSAPDDSEHARDAGPPRRTAGRITGGIVLVLVAIVLLVGGIHAIVDPSAVVAGSSRSARSPDTDGEAQFSGLLLCSFGITVLCFAIALFQRKTPTAGTPTGNEVG
ncbi:hypothetical protein [Nocardia mexicana]|uniref:Uncharacterized protein n=1 Tax=Nocardia mexicana TaxID=279262 RepID=A0A370H5V8_9NOCA|nr:hypothetical protein [Nocardia mexicana]RDI51148.1 hypothetical protein DFR68_105626 [Nocardia mexicana]